MIKKLFASTAIMLTASVPAVAGSLDTPVVETPPVISIAAPEIDWTGFYAGVQGHLGVSPALVGGGGVHAGYLYDMGQTVFGGELNYSYIFGPNVHLVGADAIFGFDAGDVMPHLTLGGAWNNVDGLGVSAGAGVSLLATDNVMLTGRYRYNYYPGTLFQTHAFTVGASIRF